MKTAKQREEEFRADLAELLKRHEAEMQVTDDGKPWGFHSGVCIISMDGEWINGEPTKEYTEFRIG